MAENKKAKAAKNTKKASKTQSVRKNGSYDVHGDKAEREGIKSTVSKKALNKSAKDDDDDESPTLKERIAAVSWKDVGIVGSAIFVPIMLIVGGISYNVGVSNQPEVEEQPEKVRNIEGAYSVLDRADGRKDDQIKALRKQIGTMRGSDDISEEEWQALSQINQDAVEVLEPFFDQVLGIARNARQAELDNYQTQLSEYLTRSASTSRFYNFLNGSSPAKQLNAKVTKVGPIVPLWAGTSPGPTRSLLIEVPIATEETTMSAQYMVTLDDRLIDEVEYLGLAFDHASPIQSALANQLSGDEAMLSRDRRGNSDDVSTKEEDEPEKVERGKPAPEHESVEENHDSEQGNASDQGGNDAFNKHKEADSEIGLGLSN